MRRVVQVGMAAMLVLAAPAAADGTPAATGVASTPPLGWDSWNTFGCHVDEHDIEAQADAMVATGLRDAGYRYVVVDDCWYAPERGPDGRLRPDPGRFPDGMAALGHYLHARGLKFGLYAVAGRRSCAQQKGNYPGATGSRGHERLDAATFASWGVDYLKYDWCSSDSGYPAQRRAFTRMRDALRATGRRIVFSVNPNSGLRAAWKYQGMVAPGLLHGWAGVASMARVTDDVDPTWFRTPTPDNSHIGVSQEIPAAADLGGRVRPGYWNDLDLLVVGVRPAAGSPEHGVSRAEARSQFGIWAMMSAPLIAGNDLTAMPPAVRAVLADRAVLAVDQDPAARPADPVPGSGLTVWVKRLGDGSLAVALYNPGDRPRALTATPGSLGLAGRYRVVDLWSGQAGSAAGPISRVVAAHDTVLLRVTRADGGSGG
jgi:alpha-galactosidase